LYLRKYGVQVPAFLVCWCLECPPNCLYCSYNDTVEATMCSDCDYGYVKRLSDGQCYGKYFVSDARPVTSSLRQNRAVTTVPN